MLKLQLLINQYQVEFNCFLLLAECEIQLVDQVPQLIEFLCQSRLIPLRTSFNVELDVLNLILATIHVFRDGAKHLLLLRKSLLGI